MSDNKIRTVTKDGITYDIEDSRVDGLPGQVEQNTNDISGLNRDIQNLEGRVETLEGRPIGNVMSYIVNNDPDVLDSDFVDKLLLGDIILCITDNYAYTVTYIDDDYKTLRTITSQEIRDYTYIKEENV